MLEGIKIIEIEGLGPGPFAAMMLADLGAEVICVQRPGGPPLATGAERNLLDRGKKTIALDLKSPEDRPILEALIRSADALIEGFRPGVMERLGLGPDTCHGLNPRLIYGRMTGWGQDGPRASQAGHDLAYIGVSGALWYASSFGDDPQTPPTLVGDIGGGALYLVAGILSGIIAAGRTGKGCVVDAAIVDGSAHMMTLLMSLWAGGAFQSARGQSLLDGPPWSCSYMCNDGRHMTVQALEPKFYAEFLARMELSDHPDLAEQMNPATWRKAFSVLSAKFYSQSQAYWVKQFEGSDACVAPVLPPDEAAEEPHMKARDTWIRAQGMLQARPAPRFDGKAADPGEAPLRDQHRDEILKGLNLA